MMLFKKLKDRLMTVEVVLDAIVGLLEKRDVMSRSEVQMEILARAEENKDGQAIREDFDE